MYKQVGKRGEPKNSITAPFMDLADPQDVVVFPST